MHMEFLFKDGECFPECHASSLVRLSNGDILCVYFAGKHEKNDDVAIYLSRRTKSIWEKPRFLAMRSSSASGVSPSSAVTL